MKKILSFALSVSLCLSAAFTASAAGLEAITGSGGNILAENFSEANMFEGKVFTKNDTGKSIPGWGMIAEQSEISGIDVSAFGEKEYQIPLKPTDTQKDIGIQIKPTEQSTKIAYLDVWNIPVANIKGAAKYRFEYNIYTSLAAGQKTGDILSEFAFYTSDVPSATKKIGVFAFKRDGTIGTCTDQTKSTYTAIQTESGEKVTYKNNAWQHVSVDFNANDGTYDLYLNGVQILKDKKLTHKVLWNAESGTYRVRLSYKPLGGDRESFVVFDDILFAKHVDSVKEPEFLSMTAKNGAKSTDLSAFSPDTESLSFSADGALSDSSVKLSKDGSPLAFSGSYQNNAYTVKPSALLPLTSYSVVFDRFTSADGKTFFAEPVELKLKTRSGKAFVSNFGFSKNGTAVTSLSGADETIAVSADVYSAKGTNAKLICVLFDQNGTPVQTFATETETIDAGKSKSLSVTLTGFTAVNGGELKAFITDGSEENAFPLWNAVSIQ